MRRVTTNNLRPPHGKGRAHDVPRAHVCAGRSAYTLIELLIVVAIISVAAGIAIPRYGNSVGRYRAECAAKRVVADLALARAGAKAIAAKRVVSFNTVANGYTVSNQRHLDDAKRPYTVNLGDGPYHATLHYADFGGVPQAEFDMYGNAVFGGKVVVRVGDHERVIDVPAGGGEVTFK
ncbi:MAG TPA: type II secretion system protein [Tepidisphaeraceae bacterium]|nr:type II secretion system protein [Tepidisphaeraceae bacterium]